METDINADSHCRGGVGVPGQGWVYLPGGTCQGGTCPGTPPVDKQTRVKT